MITNVSHVPHMSANMLFVPQFTLIDKKVEIWLDKFVVEDIKNDFEVVFEEGILDPKEKCISFVTLMVQRKKLDHLYLLMIEAAS